MTTAAIKPGGAAGFGDRLYAAMRTFGPVCVGIDPHAGLLREWGLDDDASGVREFSLRVIEALGGTLERQREVEDPARVDFPVHNQVDPAGPSRPAT